MFSIIIIVLNLVVLVAIFNLGSKIDDIAKRVRRLEVVPAPEPASGASSGSTGKP